MGSNKLKKQIANVNIFGIILLYFILQFFGIVELRFVFLYLAGFYIIVQAEI